MWILIVTLALLIVVESALVGLATAAVFQRFQWVPRASRMLLIFFATFALLDNFYLPALQVLDATLEIRNPEFSQLIGPGSPIDLAEWLSPTLEDPLWWALQSVLALAATRITPQQERTRVD